MHGLPPRLQQFHIYLSDNILAAAACCDMQLAGDARVTTSLRFEAGYLRTGTVRRYRQGVAAPVLQLLASPPCFTCQLHHVCKHQPPVVRTS
jgi:hypothetical protein